MGIFLRLVRGMAGAVEAQSKAHPVPPKNECIREHRFSSKERTELGPELLTLFSCPPVVPVVIGTEYSGSGDCFPQLMPFDHKLAATYYYQAWPQTVERAIETAIKAQPEWERTPIADRCDIFNKAADLMAGCHRQRIIAAAMIGQAMTAIQAEYNLCQLIDYTRFNSNFLRDLTTSRCVTKGDGATNLNHYHGLEGFFAAITPSDSISMAGQLAITPAIMGNGVVWKPSEFSVLACYRILESLICAGLPPGVISFVPAEENGFLSSIASNKKLAGVAFGGTTATLQTIWKRIGENIRCYNRFPRIAGTGTPKNFHIVHGSADLPCAVANTIRAAFEMAGQKTTSCSRVYVQETVLSRFLKGMSKELKQLFVTYPLDYRCFTSAVVSLEAYNRVVGYLYAHVNDNKSKLIYGGRANVSVGYYVEPTVILVHTAEHPLLVEDVRGPILAVMAFKDTADLVEAVGKAPYAMCGAIFAKDEKWTRTAVGALRDLATMLVVNDRCSEEIPTQQSLGGSRKSGPGSKAGSISYLLSFCNERSLREVDTPNTSVVYPYQTECPCPCPCPCCNTSIKMTKTADSLSDKITNKTDELIEKMTDRSGTLCNEMTNWSDGVCSKMTDASGSLCNEMTDDLCSKMTDASDDLCNRMTNATDRPCVIL